MKGADCHNFYYGRDIQTFFLSFIENLLFVINWNFSPQRKTHPRTPFIYQLNKHIYECYEWDFLNHSKSTSRMVFLKKKKHNKFMLFWMKQVKIAKIRFWSISFRSSSPQNISWCVHKTKTKRRKQVFSWIFDSDLGFSRDGYVCVLMGFLDTIFALFYVLRIQHKKYKIRRQYKKDNVAVVELFGIVSFFQVEMWFALPKLK